MIGVAETYEWRWLTDQEVLDGDLDGTCRHAVCEVPEGLVRVPVSHELASEWGEEQTNAEVTALIEEAHAKMQEIAELRVVKVPLAHHPGLVEAQRRADERVEQLLSPAALEQLRAGERELERKVLEGEGT